MDSVEAIVDDLRALSGSKRRRVLADLTPAERKAVEDLLSARGEDGSPAPAGMRLPANLSPWLRERLERGLGESPSGLTDRGRAALVEILQGLAASQPEPPPAADIAGPSLLGRMARRLTGGGRRA